MSGPFIRTSVRNIRKNPTLSVLTETLVPSSEHSMPRSSIANDPTLAAVIAASGSCFCTSMTDAVIPAPRNVTERARSKRTDRFKTQVPAGKQIKALASGPICKSSLLIASN